MIIWWFLTNYATQILYLAGGIFVANGLRKALLKPRVTYVGHVKVDKDTYLLEVMRQELMPPWRTLKERWRVKPSHSLDKWSADRELDGMDANRTLTLRLNMLAEWAVEREKEIAVLSKVDKP